MDFVFDGVQSSIVVLEVWKEDRDTTVLEIVLIFHWFLLFSPEEVYFKLHPLKSHGLLIDFVDSDPQLFLYIMLCFLCSCGIGHFNGELRRDEMPEELHSVHFDEVQKEVHWVTTHDYLYFGTQDLPVLILSQIMLVRQHVEEWELVLAFVSLLDIYLIKQLFYLRSEFLEEAFSILFL
jgi:hypothetical protein